MPTRAGATATFVVVAGVVGALTGLVAGSFRLALETAARWHTGLVSIGHHHGIGGAPAYGLVVVVLGGALATGAAAWLVHRLEPHAEGSGIPRIEGIVQGRIEPGRFRVLPVKYVGGLLSIGAGLALGREGPSVQMGGSIAGLVGRLTRRSAADIRLLVAAGAAAGLATAFNAPIAGGVFVLEELLRRFDPRTSLATLSASAAGFVTARVFLREGTEFRVPHLDGPSLAHSPAVAVLGVVAGFLGVLYNHSILGALRAVDASRIHPAVRAGVVGAVVGGVAWCAPRLVGGGDGLTQDALQGSGTLLTVLGVLAARWVLGVASYAALTPGGLFAPILVMGTTTGELVGIVGHHVVPAATPSPSAMALIGMAAFFTASIRAPVTGIVLTTEMTGSTILLPPMLGACALAMAVPAVLGARPIYDLLAERAARGAALNEAERQPRPSRSASRWSTGSGTSPETSPPSEATSLTRLDDT